MAELLVWGGGGHGRVVADVARSAGRSVVGYADADPKIRGAVVDAAGGSVILDEDEMQAWLQGAAGRALALGVGANDLRLGRSRLLQDDRLPALVHGRAVIGSGVQLGPGAVVMAGAVINASAAIGRAVIINTASVVEHDAVICDGAHIAPGAVLAGGSHVGEQALVGANATVLPSVRVGAGAVIGAGCVVRHDVPAGATVAGNPARKLR